MSPTYYWIRFQSNLTGTIYEEAFPFETERALFMLLVGEDVTI